MAWFSGASCLAGLIGTVLASSPTLADDCDVHGNWSLRQSNGFTVALGINQTGSKLVGDAGFPNEVRTAKLTGSVHGTDIVFKIRWPGGSVGLYHGVADDNGFFRGETHDQKDPSSNASWYSLASMC